MRLTRWLWWTPSIVILGAASPTEQVDFGKDIRPILAQKCVPCHSEGGSGPFALQTFAQARKRGDLIRLVSLTGQMPPTDARSDLVSLTPHQPLIGTELRTIQEWFRLGMPEGAKTKPLPTPEKRKPFVSDHVVVAQVGKGQAIPSEGRSATVVYPINSLSGQVGYLGYFSFQPDAPKAVRQVVLAVQRPGQQPPFTQTGLRPGTSYAVWSDGFNPWQSGSGYISVEKEDRLWLRVIAVPTGKPEPASGLMTFGREYRSDKVQTKTMGNDTFVVEAEKIVTLRDEWVLDQDIDLISILPEARFVTDQVRFIAKSGTGEKLVAMVHTWDATWPGAYNFAKPLRLRKGTSLIYEASVPNTKHGHAAEDEKSQTLRFGPRSTDELFSCHINYIPR
ncbi:MAG: hypothetical protein H7Y17_11200 [Chlorobia bacterium]|nr:hypothetical protein [Fimbriimonadaceae bacterium]